MFNFFKKKNVVLPLRNPKAILIEQIEKIVPSNMGKVFVSEHSARVIRVPYQSIQEYNQYLIQIKAALEHKHLFQNRLFQSPLLSIYLDDWFTTSSKIYLDPVEHTARYKVVASELVKQYILLEDFESDSKQQALTFIGPVINQVKEITEHLVSVSNLKLATVASAIKSNRI